MRLLIISCLLLASALAQTERKVGEEGFTPPGPSAKTVEQDYTAFSETIKKQGQEVANLHKLASEQHEMYETFSNGLEAGMETQEAVLDKTAQDSKAAIEKAEAAKHTAEKAAEAEQQKEEKDLKAAQKKLHDAKEEVAEAEAEAGQAETNAQDQKKTVIEAAEQDGKAKIDAANTDFRSVQETAKAAHDAKAQEERELQDEAMAQKKSDDEAVERQRLEVEKAKEENAKVAKKIEEESAQTVAEHEAKAEEIDGQIEKLSQEGEAMQAEIEAQAEADSKRLKEKSDELAAESEERQKQAKEKLNAQLAKQEEKTKKEDEAFVAAKKLSADKSHADIEKVNTDVQNKIKEDSESLKKKAEQIQKHAVAKATADAQIAIKKEETKIAQDVKGKVEAEKTEFTEDLAPLEKELDRWAKKTDLLKKQTKEMLTHGNDHFSQGLAKLSKLREAHSSEMTDFNKEAEKSVATATESEDPLNFPLILGLTFTNVLTAGYAYNFYRSTKQMRSFHSSLMEF